MTGASNFVIHNLNKTRRIVYTGWINPEFIDTLAAITNQRACRTCDYGNDPACGHEQRAERVCAAPVGNFDCAALPCLGSCTNPDPTPSATHTATSEKD